MDLFQPVAIGSDFLGYRIEELIGRGGMGVVYRAYDLRLKRPVALKLVAPRLARDERFRRRFERESELVMSLEHPNVVPIYDAGDVDGHVYLAMRLVDGTDLGSLLRTEGALEPARTTAICRQIAAALDAAHARGLVHRDVKPSNVLLDASEHVYLADFGLTRSVGDEGSVTGEERSIGTPAYLAPEQLEGRPPDGRADVYSLGCVLYECLTGEPVFPRASRLAVAWAHLEEAPPRASRQSERLPEAVDAVVEKALAKAPEQRFETCGALVGAAEDALGLRRIGTSRRRVLLAAGAAAAVVAAIAGSVVLAMMHLSGDKGNASTVTTPASGLPPGGKVVAGIRVGRSLVAVGREGGGPLAVGENAVWAMSDGKSTLMRIDPARNVVVARIKASPPESVAAGDGGVWLSNPAENNVTRIDPATNTPTATIAVGSQPEGIAVSPGAVWVANAGGPSVSRIDPATNRVVATIRVGSKGDCCAEHTSLIASPRAVWVAVTNGQRIVRIDPATNSVVATVRIGYRPCGPLAADGTRIWSTSGDCGGDVVEGVDSRTNTLMPPLAEQNPVGIVFAFGSVWVASNSGDVDQIDPHTGRLVARLPTVSLPVGIGVGFRSVWIGDFYGRVLRINPQR